MTDTLDPAGTHPAGLTAATFVFEGAVWYTFSVDTIRSSVLNKIAALEGQKLGLVIELLELEAVLKFGVDGGQPRTQMLAVPTDLEGHKARLNTGIAEYDLRIGALIEALNRVEL